MPSERYNITVTVQPSGGAGRNLQITFRDILRTDIMAPSYPAALRLVVQQFERLEGGGDIDIEVGDDDNPPAKLGGAA